MDRRCAAGTLLALALAVAAGARWFHLSDRVVWFDEAVSMLVARAPSVRAAFEAARAEGHPPLFNLVLHYWTRLAPGEMGARWLSVLLGVATVGVVGAIGERVGGRLAGVTSALLLALCPLHVWYSQEIRMYALQVLLISLSYLLMLIALEKRLPAIWLMYVLVTALSLYTQYTSFFALAAQNIYILVTQRRRRDVLTAWMLAQCAILVLFAPWLGQLVHHLQQKAQGYWIRPLTWDMPVKFFSLLSGSYLTDERGRWLVVGITLLLLVAALAVVWRDKEARNGTWLLTLWLFVPFVLLVLISSRQNLFLPRVILFVAPAFALLVGCAAAGMFRQPQRALAIMGLGTLFALNLYALHGYYSRDNWWVKSALRTVSHAIARESCTDDLVLHSSQFTYRPFQFYLGDQVRQKMIVPPEQNPRLFEIIGNGHEPALADQCQRFWLVVAPDFLHPGVHQRVLDWINKHHHLVLVLHDSTMLYVGLYDRGDAPVTPPPTVIDPTTGSQAIMGVRQFYGRRYTTLGGFRGARTDLLHALELINAGMLDSPADPKCVASPAGDFHA